MIFVQESGYFLNLSKYSQNPPLQCQSSSKLYTFIKKYNKFRQNNRAMFSLCIPDDQKDKREKQPQPLKFRILKSLNLLDSLLEKLALPRKKEAYTFKKDFLAYIDYQECNNIPILHFPVPSPSTSILFVYCHGSGSTLNNVYSLGTHIRLKYSVGFIAYDYTGEGESQRTFTSYEGDLKVVLAWALQQGYELKRIILCGFSIGCFSALCLEGMMTRILISPFAGIIPLIEQTEARYEGEMFDNVQNAEKIKARVLMLHGRNETIPLYHSHVIMDALLLNNPIQKIDLFELDGYIHNTISSFLVSTEGEPIVMDFFKKAFKEANEAQEDDPTIKLQKELKEIGEKLLVRKPQI